MIPPHQISMDGLKGDYAIDLAASVMTDREHKRLTATLRIDDGWCVFFLVTDLRTGNTFETQQLATAIRRYNEI